MKKKYSISRTIILFFLVFLAIFIIGFPILLRTIISIREEAAIAKGYRCIEMIEKKALQEKKISSENKIINIKDFNLSFLQKEKVTGKVTFSNGILTKADLLIDGYNFKYELKKKNENNNVKTTYHINSKEKLNEINPSWKIFIKTITTYNENYKESHYTLAYKYYGKKYILTLKNEEDCKKIMNKLLKLKNYKNISCKPKYKRVINDEQLCVLFEKDCLFCYNINSLSNIKLIKKQLENKFKNNIECSIKQKKLYCSDKSGLTLVVKKSNYLKVSNKNNIKCSFLKGESPKCLLN